jgi:hypothetical protein
MSLVTGPRLAYLATLVYIAIGASLALVGRLAQ